MHRMTVAVIIATIIAAPGAWAELEILDKPLWVFPGQPFRIALGQPAGSGELRVEYPDSVEMFDRWDQDDRQRFYFRALEPGDAPIAFSGAGGELSINVEVIPWGDVYEPREYESVELPRLWPMSGELEALKPGRTMYTDGEIEQMRAEGGSPGPIAQKWLAMTDEEVWEIIPGPAIPRTCLMVLGSVEPDRGVGKGCPVCGTDIYEGRSGFYPWIMDAEEHPWKVKCPNCETLFPSNDWQSGDMHSGPFPDDGWGCEPVEPVSGESGTPWRWPFIAYYHQWQAYMETLTPGIIQAAEAYIRTGDERYAHKCGVALARFAQAHLDMSVNLNHRKRVNRDGVYRGPVGAPIKDRFTALSGSFSYIQPNWDTPRMENAMRAYDLIFDHITEDEELIAFVRDQYHPEIESAEDLHRFLHAGIVRTCAQYGIDNAVSRNWPMQERMVATMALGLGQPQAMELVDHLLNGPPGLRYSLTNEYLKDGAGHETGGYNRIQVNYMAGLADVFSRLEDRMPEAYQPPEFISLAGDPKFPQIFDFHLRTSLIGRLTDETGDAGHPSTDPAAPRQGKPLNEADFAKAFEWTGIERFAQAAWGPGGSVPDVITDPQIAARIERIGRERGWQIDLPSDVLDGYGHAILRSGEGERQRALWMRYGVAVQHKHNDMLTIGLAALKRNLLPELGYPVGWTYAGAWEKNWGTHYGTHITGVSTGSFPIGSVETFAASTPAQYARSRTQVHTGADPRPLRERAIALVDIDGKDFYAISIERVSGGAQHTRSFHGPSGPAAVTGADLQPQGGGTVAGLDVPWRDTSYAPGGDGELVSLAFMSDPMIGEVSGPLQARFELEGQDDVFVHTTHFAPADCRLWTAECTAPGGRGSYDATWLVMQRSGEEPLASQFATVIEAYEGARRVHSVTPLQVTGGTEGDFAPLALRIEGEGFVDTLIIQPPPGATCTVEGGLTSDAEFALWRESDGEMATAVLVRGTSLQRGDRGVSLGRSEYTGIIEACNWDERTVRVALDTAEAQELRTNVPDGAGMIDVEFAGMTDADASALVGRMAHITNERANRATHRILGAEAVEGGIELTLDYDPRVAEGPVAEVSDGAVTSGTSFTLDRFGYYLGKTLANEDASASWRIGHIDSRTTPVIDTDYHGEVSAGTLREAFADRDGDGVARLLLYDYGPGDTVTIPCWASVTRR